MDNTPADSVAIPYRPTDDRHSNPLQPIRVFISSKCDNDGPYTKLRRELESKIDETPFFTAYTWERGGASTSSAKETYCWQLNDSNLCVFIIDDSLDLPEGVKNEIHEALEQGKKSLYYFRTDEGKPPSDLRASFNGPEGPTYKTVSTLEELPIRILDDLHEDVITTYRKWCASYFASPLNSAPLSMEEIQNLPQVHLPSTALHPLNKTASVFINILFGYADDSDPSNALDEALSALTRALYIDFKIGDFDSQKLIESLDSLFPPEYIEIIKIRWSANKAYFAGRTADAIDELEKGLAAAKKQNLEHWLISDILIDLRNLKYELNSPLLPNSAQEELNKDPLPIVFPQIDRYRTSFYEKVSEGSFKDLTSSMESRVFGEDLTRFIDDIFLVFSVAACFGSLTHLSRTILLMRDLTRYLITKTPTSNIGLNLIKFSIASGKYREGKTLVSKLAADRFFADPDDTMQLFQFCTNYRSLNQNKLATVEAFEIAGPYMSDADFTKASAIFISNAEKFLDDKHISLNKIKAILIAIHSNSSRLSPPWVIDFFTRVLQSNNESFIREIVNFLASYRLFRKYPLQETARLFNELSRLLSDETFRSLTSEFFDAVAALYIFNDGDIPLEYFKTAVGLLPKNLQERMVFVTRGFLPDKLLLERANEEIILLESELKRQEEDGCYSLGADHARLFARHIIQAKAPDIEILHKGIDLLFKVLSSNQLHAYSLRVNAAKALELLLKNFTANEIDPSHSLLNRVEINNNKQPLLFFGENESLFLFEVHLSALKIVINHDSGERLIVLLSRACSQDLFTQAHISDALHVLLYPQNIGLVPRSVLSSVFAYASYMSFSNDAQLSARGTQLLIELLADNDLARIVCKLLSDYFPREPLHSKLIIVDNFAAIQRISPEISAQIESHVQNSVTPSIREHLQESLAQTAQSTQDHGY